MSLTNLTRVNPARAVQPIREGRVIAWRYGAFPATTLAIPEPLLLEARDVLDGRFDFPKHRDEPDVRTFLDVGAGCGAFMAWCTRRFQYAWIDAIELDKDLCRLALMNAPPGARVFNTNITEEVTELVDGMPTDLVDMRVAVDGVHCSPAFDVQSLRVDFNVLKVACVEVSSTRDWVRTARFFGELGFTIAAADARSQTWIRLKGPMT